MSRSSPSNCSPSFRRWLRSINKGFYTHCSWSWRIGGTLVTHWGNDNVKIYHQGGRHTETHPANTERCREAIQALLSKANAPVSAAAATTSHDNNPMNKDTTLTPDRARSAEGACYAVPLTRTQVEEAAKWLGYCIQLMNDQLARMADLNMPKLAAAFAAEIPKVDKLIAGLNAALHNAAGEPQPTRDSRKP